MKFYEINGKIQHKNQILINKLKIKQFNYEFTSWNSKV